MSNKTLIKKAILEAVKSRVEAALVLSQRACGTDETLKNSGSATHSPVGSTLKYTAPYAETKERGCEAHDETVAGYYRGGSYVRGHTRHVPAQAGTHFIQTAMTESFKEFSSDFNTQLSNQFKSVLKG